MIRLSSLFIILCAALLLGGCATSSQHPSAAASSATKSTAQASKKTPPGDSATKPINPSAAVAPGSALASASESGNASTAQTASNSALPEGEFSVLVDSEPDGGMIVVNGIPIGKAPQRVVLPGTPRGFFRDPVSLKVRFIAADSNQSSQTVEEMLTPLDRIPAEVRFSRSGPSRVPR
jgi:hypothetical protein